MSDTDIATDTATTAAAAAAAADTAAAAAAAAPVRKPPTFTTEDGRDFISRSRRIVVNVESALHAGVTHGLSPKKANTIRNRSIFTLVQLVVNYLELTPEVVTNIAELAESVRKAKECGKGRTLKGGFDALAFAENFLGERPTQNEMLAILVEKD